MKVPHHNFFFEINYFEDIFILIFLFFSPRELPLFWYTPYILYYVFYHKILIDNYYETTQRNFIRVIPKTDYRRKLHLLCLLSPYYIINYNIVHSAVCK